MKKQLMDFNHSDNKTERVISEGYNLYVILGGVLVFHVIAFIFVYKFYHTAGVNVYMKIAIIATLFEGGIFIGVMEGKLKEMIKKAFLLTCVLGAMLVAAMPIILFAAPVVIAGMLTIAILGVSFGRLFLKVDTFTVLGLVKFVAVSMIIVNIAIIGNIIVKMDSCKSNSCLKDKATRYKDEKFCVGITSSYDRGNCYMNVLFDFEKENIKSEKQCDIIDFSDDRDRCYVWVAKNILKKDICKEIESDEIIRDCYEEVARYECYALPWTERGGCLDKINDSKNKRSNTPLNKSREITELSNRSNDIETLKIIVNNTREYVERCDTGGGIVRDTIGREDRLSFVCDPKDDSIAQSPQNGFVPWGPLFDVCGEDRSARDWIVSRENGEWVYTIKCERYLECTGYDNLRCTKEGCIFSEKCS
jgi:hypothetical protein